jgi:hypothetical protein
VLKSFRGLSDWATKKRRQTASMSGLSACVMCTTRGSTAKRRRGARAAKPTRLHKAPLRAAAHFYGPIIMIHQIHGESPVVPASYGAFYTQAGGLLLAFSCLFFPAIRRSNPSSVAIKGYLSTQASNHTGEPPPNAIPSAAPAERAHCTFSFACPLRPTGSTPLPGPSLKMGN